MGYLQTNATATLGAGKYGLTGAGYGNSNNVSPGWSGAGPATVASGGAVTGYTDYNVAGKTPVANLALTGSVSTAWILNLAGLNTASATTSNGFYYFPIDGTRFLGIETAAPTNQSPELGILQIEGISP
jgi:hypothetical protein